MLKKTLQIVAPLGLAAFFLWFTFKDEDFSKIAAHLQKANYFIVLLSFVPTLLSHFSRAKRWQMLLEPVNQKVSWRNSFIAVMSGYFANYILPRMGEVTRCVVLKGTDDVPVQTSLGTVVAERGLDMIMLLLITALGFFLEYDTLFTFFEQMLSSKSGTSSGFDLKLVFLGIVAFGGILFFILRKQLLKIPIVQKIWEFVAGLLEGVLSVLKLKNRNAFIFHTLVIWGGYFSTTYISFFMLQETSHLNLTAALLIFVVGSFGMVAPVQGGIGPFHYMVSTGLIQFYQIASDSANSSALLMHTSQMIFNLVLGGICYLGFLVVMNKKKDDSNAK